MNISSYDADSEAEGTCSLMARKGLVDGVLTEDTDVMAYGSPYMYFGINLNSETINELCLTEVLEHLEITFQNLQDFCIMCGTDYNTNMKQIGPMRSFDLVQKYGSLEKVNEALRNGELDDLMRSFSFRIPTQAINSADSVRVKKFLPSELGDIVIMPTDIVAKAGSDYDIDKLSMYFKAFDFELPVSELTKAVVAINRRLTLNNYGDLLFDPTKEKSMDDLQKILEEGDDNIDALDDYENLVYRTFESQQIKLNTPTAADLVLQAINSGTGGDQNQFRELGSKSYGEKQERLRGECRRYGGIIAKLLTRQSRRKPERESWASCCRR